MGTGEIALITSACMLICSVLTFIFARSGDHGKPGGFPSELADVTIRVLDICALYDIDIQAAIGLKMAYNKTRPYRHGGKRC